MKALPLLAAAALSLAGMAHAQTAATVAQAASAVPAAGMSDGEVRKIDKEAGKLTLRHGPIRSLDMPGMTMVFRVTDPKMLDAVKEGDKVRFAADRVNGAITVTALELVR